MFYWELCQMHSFIFCSSLSCPRRCRRRLPRPILSYSFIFCHGPSRFFFVFPSNKPIPTFERSIPTHPQIRSLLTGRWSDYNWPPLIIKIRINWRWLVAIRIPFIQFRIRVCPMLLLEPLIHRKCVTNRVLQFSTIRP